MEGSLSEFSRDILERFIASSTSQTIFPRYGQLIPQTVSSELNQAGPIKIRQDIPLDIDILNILVFNMMTKTALKLQYSTGLLILVSTSRREKFSP